MYFLTSPFKESNSYLVTINSTNEYIATAGGDGNVSIRSMSKFQKLIPTVTEPVEATEPTPTAPKPESAPSDPQEQQQLQHPTSTEDKSCNGKSSLPETEEGIKKPKTEPSITTASEKVGLTPSINRSNIEQAQKPDYLINVRSRSKITTMKYANLKSNANDLVAVYKNGEIYLIEDANDPEKHKITQLFKHVNGLILDFSWSADDQLLAFSTINNQVIIYDMVYRTILSTLQLHQEHGDESSVAVKAIDFDHASSKFLFTLGDDKFCNVVEYSLESDPETGRKFTYRISQKIGDLINSSKLNKATIRKMSITNDDKIISCPNTAKGKMSLISLLSNSQPETKEGNWENWCSLAGRGFKCTMTQFSPCIYSNPENQNPLDNSPDKGKYYYILATASVDSTVAIWNTASVAPLIIANDVSQHALQDICWSGDGRLLFITTSAGEMLIGCFGENELGQVVSPGDLGTDVDLDKITQEKMITEIPLRDEWLKKQKELSEAKKTDAVTSEERNKRPEVKLEEASLDGKIDLTPEEPVTTKPAKESPVLAANSDLSVPNTATLTTTKNNKKIIQPTLLSSNGKEKTPPSSVPTLATDSKKRPISTTEFDTPSSSVSKDLMSKMNKLIKKEDTSQPAQVGPATKKKRELEPIEFIGSVVLNPQISFSNIRISVPRVKIYLKQILPSDESMLLEVKNGNGNESQPTRIALFKKISDESKKEIFVDFIPHRVHLATGSNKYWAISTSNGHVIIYSDSGRRVLPPIILGSPLSFLEIKSQYLMAVTSLGELFVWDLDLKKSLFKPTSLYPLLQPIYKQNTNENVVDANGIILINGDILTRSENLTMCSITANGLPVVTLSNGNGYLFNHQMNSWSLISDSWWAFGSQYWDSSRTLNAVDGDSVLSFLECHTNEEIIRKGKGKFFNKISKVMLMKEGYENLETVISLNHLENKILIYEYLGDVKNFKNFLIIYVKRLGELNFKSRLIEIFQELFIGMDGTVCGISKKDLLQDLILNCSKFREVQRILIQYGESIGLIEDELL